MKTKLLILTAIAVLTAFSGCGKDNVSKTNGDSGTVHLTSQTFKQKVFDYEKNKEWKYEGETPCIVDFYADWCGPCKQIAPILEQISKDYEGKINVYKVNVDNEQQLASAFGINSIPAVLFVPKTGQPQMTTGAMPKEGFVKAINDILLKQ
jgi:thioredoxin